MTKLDKLFNEFKTEFNYFSDDDNKNIQANENCYSYSFSTEDLNTLTVEELDNFIKKHENLYMEESNYNVIFYCWFDELADQLRISGISKRFNSLAFGCDIKQSKLDLVLTECINKKGTLFNKEILNVYSANQKPS